MTIAAINEQLLRAIGVGIAIVGGDDLDFRFTNEKFTSWFGIPDEDATLDSIFPGIDLETLRDDLAHGRSHNVEMSIKPKRRPLVIALAVNKTLSGNEALVVVECQNITRIRELESMIDSYSAMVERNTRDIEREKEKAERLLLIEVITRAANEAVTTEEAMQIALQRICVHTQWPIGHAYLLSDRTGELEPTGIWHLDDPQRFETFRSTVEASEMSPGVGLLNGVVTGAKPAWIEDITTGNDEFVATLAEKVGVKGALAFPVLANERVVSVLEFFSEGPAQPAEPLLQAMMQIATQLGRVAERVATQEQLVVERERALGATQAKSYFLANMSHELRTPMNAIIGFTRLVMRQTKALIPEKQYGNLEKILVSSEHLLDLINQLLDLSKIEAGKYDLFLESYDLAGLLQETAESAQPLARRNNNQIRVRCAHNLGLMYADKTRFRQIVLNLLSNACKFTDNGKVTLTAGKSRVESVDWLTLRVSDTGIGMTAEQCSRVFDAFTQADSSHERRSGGTGLGLTISRRLCQMMGGNITVSSELEVGTTFTVTLPLTVELEPQQGPEEEARAAPVI